MVAGGCVGYDETWSMSVRYASYWNAFSFEIVFKICIVTSWYVWPLGESSLYFMDVGNSDGETGAYDFVGTLRHR